MNSSLVCDIFQYDKQNFDDFDNFFRPVSVLRITRENPVIALNIFSIMLQAFKRSSVR